MRIAFISDQSGPYYVGGYETRLWEFARRLAALGNEVHIFTSCPNGGVVEGVRFHRVVGYVNYFPSRGAKRGFRSLFKNGIFAIALLRFLFKKRLKMNVVDANSIPWVHLPVSWLLARWWGARFAITVHEAFGSAITGYFAAKRAPFARVQALCAAAFYRWSQNLSDAIVAASPSCVEGIRLEGIRQEITVLNSGQDAAGLEEISFAPREVTLVTTGRLVQMKRLDVLLQAAHALGDPALHIIGDGPLAGELQALAGELGLKRTVFWGRVEEGRKRELLLSSQIFVLASYREGWSLATLEAMGHGCLPIFASKPERYETGVKIYAKPGMNSLEFDGTVEELIERIRYACADRTRLASMRRRAWETARKYSWSSATAAAQRFYRSLAAAQASGVATKHAVSTYDL
jgi:glycosyltransferase involved in cell wall biosynthesis